MRTCFKCGGHGRRDKPGGECGYCGAVYSSDRIPLEIAQDAEKALATGSSRREFNPAEPPRTMGDAEWESVFRAYHMGAGRGAETRTVEIAKWLRTRLKGTFFADAADLIEKEFLGGGLS